MAVKQVQAWKVDGEFGLFASEAEADKKDAENALQAFCRKHFNGGEYDDDMIAGVLKQHANEVHTLLQKFVQAKQAAQEAVVKS